MSMTIQAKYRLLAFDEALLEIPLIPRPRCVKCVDFVGWCASAIVMRVDFFLYYLRYVGVVSLRVRTSRVDRHVRLPVLVFDIFQIFRADSTVRILGSVAGPFGESTGSATAVFLAGI